MAYSKACTNEQVKWEVNLSKQVEHAGASTIYWISNLHSSSRAPLFYVADVMPVTCAE